MLGRVGRLVGTLTAAVVCLAGAPLSAGATVITFDDITTSVTFGALDAIAPPYAGLNWSPTFAYIHKDFIAGPQGWRNGTVSGNYTAYTRFGSDGSFSVNPGDTFDLSGAYLTGVWRDDLQITIEGLLGGSTVYSQTVTVQSTGPTWFQFDYLGIDEVTFSPFGGTNAGYGTDGTHFAMDNLTLVPEPNTFALVSGGLVALGLFRRRQR